jgi:hypothetical chaperone protein
MRVPRPALGLDFGTTNSALALALGDGEGEPRLARFAGPGGATPTFRSLLYFDREDERGPVEVHAGPAALLAYLERDVHGGRLIQSMKSFLASRLFSATEIFGRSYRLEHLIGILAGRLREEAEAELGVPVRSAVVGRPVRFVGAASGEDEALALSRLHAGLVNAGFREVRFEYEPIGAARHYERGLAHDELLLIGDFGGGTSDFSLLRVGPGRARDGSARSILGNDGVDVAGDAFDGKIVRHCVTPLLGRGAEFVSFFGRRLPVPDWIYAHLERWHHVSMLKSRRTLQLLLDLRREAVEPERLDRLLRVVENDLGFVLHRATEATKRALSEGPSARFRIDHDLLQVDAEVSRPDFEAWIAPELSAIAGCVDGLLARAGIAPGAVDRVFLTGGSSLVPAVRRIFEERFDAARIRTGDEFTSVASGLALCAAEGPGS